MITNSYHCSSIFIRFFMWIDTGICVYRNNPPPSISFPNINVLNKLPKDKFIYSSKDPTYSDKFQKGNYHLYHHVTGTSYILHKNIIDSFVELYKEYLNLIDKNDIWTDQVILTHLYKDNKSLFYKYSNGYGSIVSKLF